MANADSEVPIVISSDSEASEVADMDNRPQSTGKAPGVDSDKKRAYLRAEGQAKKAYEEWKAECLGRGAAPPPLVHFTGEPKEPQRGLLPNRPQPQSGQVLVGPRSGRIAVEPPSKDEKPKPPPVVKGLKTTNVRKEAEEVFKVASRNILRLVMEAQDRAEFDRRVNGEKEESDDGWKVPASLPHEQELERMVRPATLCTDQWKGDLYKGQVPILDGDEVGAMAAKMDIMDAKLDRMLSVLHLHSVAHIASIKAGNELRLLCVSEGRQKDEVYMELQLSLRSIALAADKDLQKLPFRTMAKLLDFFRSPARVEKLAFFFLTYMDFKPGFTSEVVKMLMDGDLLERTHWPREKTDDR